MNITILDGDDIGSPEVTAMLQAMYSRSPMPIEERLEGLTSKQAIKEKMGTFYLGYGHKSIGDCGDITLFIEDVSMLAAKAVQDNQLYNGQEASTRYMDFSTARFITYSDSEEENEIQEGWRHLYLDSLEPLKALARNLYTDRDVLPESAFNDDDSADPEYHKRQNEKRVTLYEKTIKAIAFDMARGLLPCGAATNVAWHGSISSINDHLLYLRNHPLFEVQELATTLYEQLAAKYPNSFSMARFIKKVPEYLKDPMNYYSDHIHFPEGMTVTPFSVLDTEVITSHLYYSKLDQRKAKEPFPRQYRSLARFKIQGMLDFGSFRDLQRHRNGECVMPVVCAANGINPWYEAAFRQSGILDKFKAQMTKLNTFLQGKLALDYQYLCPMATNVPIDLDYHLGQLVYVLELRSSVSVHPTLRNLVEDIWDRLDTDISKFIFLDERPHYQQSNRGAQTIEERDKESTT